MNLHNIPTSQTNSSLPAWTQVLPPGSKQLISHASVLWGNYIFTIGGAHENNQNCFDVQAFDLVTQTPVVPRQVNASEKLVPRFGHSICLDEKGNAIIFGGSNGRNTLGWCTRFGISLSEGQPTITWIQAQMQARNPGDDVCPGVFNHTANIYNDKMYVFGGMINVGECLGDLWELDLGTFSWRKRTTTGQIVKPRSYHSSAISNGKLYIFGGLSNAFYPCENFMSMLDLETFRWEPIQSSGQIPRARAGTTMNEYKGKIILFGGALSFSDDHTNELFIFCTQTNTWTQVQFSGESPPPRCLHSSVVWKNQLYILGGKYDKNQESRGVDIWSLCLDDIEGLQGSNDKDKDLKIENDAFNLIELYTQKSFTDIILEAEGKQFASHKAILAQRCKFFANLFNSGMSDSNLTRLPIIGVKADCFEIMLRFIYNDPNLVVDEDQAFELLSLSDKYLLPALKTQCEKVLIRLLTLENFVKIAKAAEVVESDEIKKAVFKFARENVAILKEKGDLYLLSQSLLIELFANLVSK